jgi:hypothetical protein
VKFFARPLKATSQSYRSESSKAAKLEFSAAPFELKSKQTFQLSLILIDELFDETKQETEDLWLTGSCLMERTS